MITLPLKRVHQSRSDLHPQVFLQQHINRSLKRYARMTGSAQPSKRQLETKLHRRVYASKPGLLERKRSKRHGRLGLADARKIKDTATASASATAASGAEGLTTAEGIPEVDVEAAASGGLTLANAPTASNSLGLDIESNDVGYVATVQIGTPATDFKFLMDSGSADMWVGSAENCTTEGTTEGCGDHQFLGSSTSSSFVEIGNPFEVTYGTGQVEGVTVSDNVNIGGLALNNHTFGVANVESSDFSSDSIPFDGLMGLAQSGISEEGVPTPVEALASAGLISDAIASFKISRLADQLNDGEITFGGLDSSKFDSNTLVTFDNVNTEGFWEGDMTAVTSNGQDLGLTGRTAILDTGTTLIVAPPNDADAVHATIPGAASDGQGGFTIPCTTNTSVALTFGGRAFAINPLDLVFAPVNADDLTGDCVSGISSGEIDGATTWLVGDVFLKNAYLSVNQNTNEISLAELAQDG
ncbi:aspartic peptidase A1 [Laetiporus sulphureus 93-53]|uniref:Aspartic peptidase A1 n=1 Tax=Laetiporus sulphureus 93-53 TaxID=1314785 RepID=A0A165ESZ8_9APHY|nr:aspartic peptidase A1 [Laetiporus sulphureus 93-53]KZT07694.1 aspartic peptidase A1 [Laetiporus sulphureus 93-53]